MEDRNFVKDALLGVAVGDALGVPVEFTSRATLDKNPVTDMRAFGSHHQPAGTWSDDSSLTFCLAEMLCGDYDLQNLANRFVNWKEYGYWTAHGEVFDVGIATREAIRKMQTGIDPQRCGGADVDSNGNGSLMRILPLVFFTKYMPVAERFQHVQEVSSLTHRHIRSVIACFIYTEFSLQLLHGQEKGAAFDAARNTARTFLNDSTVCPQKETALFSRILDRTAQQYMQIPVEDISSSGYVLHTLEAALWCILQTDNYRNAVLRAVNLGSDTDTTGAVTGGLAGLIYGTENILSEWLDVLARRQDIEALGERMNARFSRP